MATMKLKPKTLTEWTLEMNIAIELSTMFNSAFGMFYPRRLRGMFDIKSFDYTRAVSQRKTRCYKLTPAEEGAGGGWDTKFVIPRKKFKDDRVIYMQFKSGTESTGNHMPGSMFNLSKKNPNRHIEFSFNDNDKVKTGKPATQHNDLKVLNEYLIKQGLSDKSVLYAFPRITDLNTFESLEEPLLFYTTFISHKQMDYEAEINLANLYDGKRHHFRCCYHDETKREISSTPYSLEFQDESIEVISEIAKVKLGRLWNDFLPNFNPESLRAYLVITLANLLKINPYEFSDNPFWNYLNAQESSSLKYHFEEIQDQRVKLEREFLSGISNQVSSTKRINIFNNCFSFLNEARQTLNLRERIPAVYTNFLSDRISDNAVDKIDFGEISVASIVF